MSVHYLITVFYIVLVLVLLLIIVVLVFVFYRIKIDSRANMWTSIIDSKIINTVLSEEKDQDLERQISYYSTHAAFRKLFLKKVIDTQKKFSGQAQKKVQSLFVEYGLREQVLKKFKSKKPHVIAMGIQELTEMQSTQDLPLIQNYLSHSSSMVNQEAQYSMTVFEGFEGLSFLSNWKDTISDWQKLRLLRSVYSVPENGAQIISKWLQCENTSVVIFALRLIKKFKPFSLYNEVRNLLEHASEEVRVEAVKSMQSIENSTIGQDFLRVYPRQSLQVQLQIIKEMNSSRDSSFRDFFFKQTKKGNNVALQINAAQALVSLGFQQDLQELLKDNSSSEELKRIVRHALQEKL